MKQNIISNQISTSRVKKMILIPRLIMLTFCVFLISSCQDEFVDIDVPPQLTAESLIFNNLSTANTALAGIYTELKFGQSLGEENFTGSSLMLGLYADELRIENAIFGQLILDQGRNFLTPESIVVVDTWSQGYNIIHASNAVIEGITNSAIEAGPLKDQYLGEAHFVRAYIHFKLVKLYGDIPYIETTDFQENAMIGKTAVSDVYAKIIEDLIVARDLMQESYTESNRVRPNKAAASAVLARAYLFMEDWENAETESSLVISHPELQSDADVTGVFLNDSPSTIWQLDEPREGANTSQSLAFNLGSLLFNPITDETLAAFEPGDTRLDNWTADAFSFTGGIGKNVAKYKFGEVAGETVERYKELRLAEQYLIRAEARARLGNIAGSQEDLNKIRQRSGLAPTSASNSDDLVDAIMQERRIELLGESGHRWFDLVRSGKANQVLSVLPAKTDWEFPKDLLYPLPIAELLINPNLEPQNPGY